jgi:nucleotide-binding universal stress UspA family protein
MPESMRTIVVGVDGSPESDGALRWALDEARLRGSTLLVVHAYQAAPIQLGETVASAAGMGAPPVYSVEDVERLREAAEGEAGGVIDGALRRVGADATAGLEVRRETVDGPPTQALIAAARDADLLVLGSRGRGGFLGLLLGSVAQQCVHHPPCPVVVVPAERQHSA